MNSIAEENRVNLASVVLAAGQSSRFGSDKRLAAYDAKDTLLSKSVALVEPFCSHVFVVTKPADRDRESELLGRWREHKKIEQVYARDANEGMGSSLANAIEFLRDFEQLHSQHFTGLLLMLADMPYIDPTTIKKIVAAHSLDKLVLPCYQCDGERKRWGHPVLFGRLWFDELQSLRGDRGGRAIVEANAGARIEVLVDDPGVLRDVDKPEDIAAV